VPEPIAAPTAATAKAASPRARRRASELKVDPMLADGTGVGGRVMEADVAALADTLKPVKITPTARRLAAARGVDIRRLTGTGPRGKIVKADVVKAAAEQPPAPAAASALAPGQVRRVPLTPMRRIIAERMAASKFSAPHYYVTVEVDMKAAVEFRASVTEFKASFNDLVLLATTKAIQRHPQVNARWADDAVEEIGTINLAFAVALPTGLVVPVIRNAESKDLREIHDHALALSEKAKTGKLTPDDYTGNTFTVSNLGVFGVDQFTAIINQPDSALLAIGQIKERPAVVDGGIHVRPIMKMTLSSDHRVVDGAVAAQFMSTLKEILENADF
jgi:pyruvate dehydrogenase E2 component (dihydrolipoamide acetyltransferase)